MFRLRLTVSVVAATVLLCAGTACAGPPAAHVATAGQGPASSSPVDAVRLAQRYVDCMRSQGVAMLDRLTAEGKPQIDKSKVDLDRLGPAMERCRRFLPHGDETQRPAAEDVAKMRRYAACLRAHGLPDYPDPDPDTGQPAMSDSLANRLKSDPHLATAMRACADLTPASGSGVVGG